MDVVRLVQWICIQRAYVCRVDDTTWEFGMCALLSPRSCYNEGFVDTHLIWGGYLVDAL
jgi:hypothetical protein